MQLAAVADPFVPAYRPSCEGEHSPKGILRGDAELRLIRLLVSLLLLLLLLSLLLSLLLLASFPLILPIPASVPASTPIAAPVTVTAAVALLPSPSLSSDEIFWLFLSLSVR